MWEHGERAPYATQATVEREGQNMPRGVVHIALEGDTAAMCDAPLNPSAPRAEEPEKASCQQCIDIYIEGWEATLEPLPDGVPPMPTYPPTAGRRPTWLKAAVVIGVALATAGTVYALSGGDSAPEDVTGSVVDCSQTEFYQPKDSPAMLPARVAQIRFVNNGDQQETFSPQVDGVTLVSNNGSTLKYTLAPHEATVIGYSVNPQKYGSSEGSCYALDITAGR